VHSVSCQRHGWFTIARILKLPIFTLVAMFAELHVDASEKPCHFSVTSLWLATRILPIREALWVGAVLERRGPNLILTNTQCAHGGLVLVRCGEVQIEVRGTTGGVRGIAPRTLPMLAAKTSGHILWVIEVVTIA
jgi:hypothetical protein